MRCCVHQSVHTAMQLGCQCLKGILCLAGMGLAASGLADVCGGAADGTSGQQPQQEEAGTPAPGRCDSSGV